MAEYSHHCALHPFLHHTLNLHVCQARQLPTTAGKLPALSCRTEGEYPLYGNDDERVDGIAREVVEAFHSKLARQHTYRSAVPTLSVLTITSNVVYGKVGGSLGAGRFCSSHALLAGVFGNGLDGSGASLVSAGKGLPGAGDGLHLPYQGQPPLKLLSYPSAVRSCQLPL